VKLKKLVDIEMRFPGVKQEPRTEQRGEVGYKECAFDVVGVGQGTDRST